MKTLFFTALIFVIIICGCTNQRNDMDWHVIEKDTTILKEISSKYIIDNKYGQGYILLNDDNTYEHFFHDGESAYLDFGIWEAIPKGNSDQHMPFGGVEVKDGYDVVLRDWYWRFPVDEKTDPHQKINESLSYETDRLSCINVAFTNAQVDFFKESVYSDKLKKYVFVPKDTTILAGDNFEDNRINLGTLRIDSIDYNVVSVFRKIGVADGFKGRSFLIFKNDSINFERTYEASMPSDLPIDIYENNFVFRRDNGLFCFDGDITLEEAVCFSCDDNGYFLSVDDN